MTKHKTFIKSFTEIQHINRFILKQERKAELQAQIMKQLAIYSEYCNESRQ